MGVEYKHGFAVKDLNKLPTTEKDFDLLQKRVSELLTKWGLTETCVERRTGTTREILSDFSDPKSDWQTKNQKLQNGLPSILEQERRLDWQPLEDEEAIQKIAGRDFEYSGVEKEAELQWIYMQLGPSFKIYSDPYGKFTIEQTNPFVCSSCGKETSVIEDPWIPGMLEQHRICPSMCTCGGTVNPGSFRIPYKDGTPSTAIWKSALFPDFGKCHPKTVLWAGRTQSREFVDELEEAFESELTQFGSWC